MIEGLEAFLGKNLVGHVQRMKYTEDPIAIQLAMQVVMLHWMRKFVDQWPVSRRAGKSIWRIYEDMRDKGKIYIFSRGYSYQSSHRNSSRLVALALIELQILSGTPRL